MATVRPRALRTGWTAGTCASAAASAANAATAALRGQPGQPGQRGQDPVQVALASGRRVRSGVASCVHELAQAAAVLVTDAGDNPDVARGARLDAAVADFAGRAVVTASRPDRVRPA